MKKKLLLVTVMVALLLCALAVSVSAAVTGSSSNEYGDLTIYDSISAKDKLDTTSRVVLVNADGTYSTYPAYYVLKNNTSASFDFAELNTLTKESYTNKSVARIELPNTVKSIGGSMFSGDTELVEIDLPTSLTSVGGSAFNGCTNLQYIDGTDGLLIFPEGFSSISANNAFYNCDKIKYVEFPSTFTYLGQAAFNDCDGLLLVSFDKINEAIANGTRTTRVDFNNCGSFKNCDNLVAMSIPELTTVVINRFASNCPNLTAVYMPNSVKQIGTNGTGGKTSNNLGAFDHCGKMYFVQESFTVSQCVVNGAIDLTKLNLPEKPSVYYMPTSLVEFIGHVESNASSKSGTVFRSCTSLNETIVFPEGFTYFNANNVFQDIGTQASPKNIVFLGDMTRYLITQNCSYINFIFVNKNDKNLYDIGVTNAYGGSSSVNSYMYFCSSGLRYDTTLISKNMNGTVYTEAYNAVYNTEYENAYAAVYDSCYESAYKNKYNNKYKELIKNGKTEAEAEAEALEYVVSEAAKSADSSAKTTAKENSIAVGVSAIIDTVINDCIKETHHIRNAALDKAQDATCTLPAGFVTYCFCGSVVSIDAADGSSPLGHELSVENGAIDLGIAYIDFLAKGEHSYACARCKEVCTEETEAMFECKGYSVSTFGDTLSMTQGFLVNRDALKEYKKYAPDFEFGLIIAGNKSENGAAFAPELSGDLCVPQSHIVHNYFDIKITGITSDFTDKLVVFCAFVKNGEKVYYLDNYTTSEAVTGISYNAVLALVG